MYYEMTRSNIPSLHKNGRSQQLVSVRSGGRRVQAREDAVPTCAAAGRQYFWCYRTVKVTWILRQERFILNLLGHSTEKKKVLLEMTLFMRFHDRSFSVHHVSIPKNSFVCWLAFSEPRCRQGARHSHRPDLPVPTATSGSASPFIPYKIQL